MSVSDYFNATGTTSNTAAQQGSVIKVEMENVTMANMSVVNTKIDAVITNGDFLKKAQDKARELTQTAVFSTGDSFSGVTLALDIDADLLDTTKSDFTLTLTDGTKFTTATTLTLGESLLSAAENSNVELVMLDAAGNELDTVSYIDNAYSIAAGSGENSSLVLCATYKGTDDVPEPASTVLAVIGLAGMAMRRRRKARA